MKKVVIIGGGYAGLICAARLHGKCDVLLIDPKEEFIERIRLHESKVERRLRYDSYFNSPGFEWMRAKVKRIDISKNKLDLIDSQNAPQEVFYDELVYAPGSSIPERSGCFPLNTRTHTRDIYQAMTDSPRQLRVGILGAGLTGIELSAELAEEFPTHQIFLLDRNPFARFPAKSRQILESFFSSKKVELKRSAFDQIPENEYDLLVWTAGFCPNQLAKESGLDCNEAGQLKVNHFLQSDQYSNIWGAGDAVCTPCNWNGQSLRSGCATAIPMGAAVADNIMRKLQAKTLRPHSFAYTFWCISLGRRNGLIQWVDKNDHPKSRVWTGRAAAWIKEMICLMTFYFIKWELRWKVPIYQWPKQ